MCTVDRRHSAGHLLTTINSITDFFYKEGEGKILVTFEEKDTILMEQPVAVVGGVGAAGSDSLRNSKCTD